MGMRLLGQKEIEKAKRNTIDDDIERISAKRAILSEEERKIDALLESKRAEKKRMEEYFGTFSALHEQRKSALTKEVEELEARKAEALKPVIERERKAENDIIAANEHQNRLIELKSELDLFSNQIKDRESSIKDKEKELARTEEELRIVAERNSLKTNELSAREANISHATTVYNAMYSKGMLALQVREKEVEAREIGMRERETLLEEEKNKLNRERLHIESQQDSLRQAFDEARKRNLL